ncbi:Regulator of chromosome condensation (RCC1) repeat protein [compost metagenome]
MQCWGNNDYGQLGNSSSVATTTPITVPTIEDAEQIVTGWYASCALKSDGSAWCWGFGTNGQLGDGLVKHTPYPVKVN